MKLSANFKKVAYPVVAALAFSAAAYYPMKLSTERFDIKTAAEENLARTTDERNALSRVFMKQTLDQAPMAQLQQTHAEYVAADKGVQKYEKQVKELTAPSAKETAIDTVAGILVLSVFFSLYMAGSRLSEVVSDTRRERRLQNVLKTGK